MNDLPNIFQTHPQPAEPFTPATSPIVESKPARKPRGARRMPTIAEVAEAAGGKPAKKPRKPREIKAPKVEPFVMSAANLLALGASLPPEAAAVVGKYVDDFNGMALDIRNVVLDTLRKIYG